MLESLRAHDDDDSEDVLLEACLAGEAPTLSFCFWRRGCRQAKGGGDDVDEHDDEETDEDVDES